MTVECLHLWIFIFGLFAWGCSNDVFLLNRYKGKAQSPVIGAQRNLKRLNPYWNRLSRKSFTDSQQWLYSFKSKLFFLLSFSSLHSFLFLLLKLSHSNWFFFSSLCHVRPFNIFTILLSDQNPPSLKSESFLAADFNSIFCDLLHPIIFFLWVF